VAAVALSLRGPAGPDRSVLWSLLGHGLLLALIIAGGIAIPHSPPPTRLAIKATVVDPDARRPPAARSPAPKPVAPPEAKPEPRPEPQAEARPEPRPEPKPRASPPAEDAQKAAAKARERQQAEAAAAVQRADAQRREKELLEKQRTEQQKEQQKQQAAAEKQQQEKAARLREAAAQREIARQLAEEERLQAASESGALAEYRDLIMQKVARNWIRPPGAAAGLECVLTVAQIPGGQVVGVNIESCNADATVRRSIEAAVLKASPLPLPDDPALFDRNLRFTFKPEQ